MSSVRSECKQNICLIVIFVKLNDASRVKRKKGRSPFASKDFIKQPDKKPSATKQKLFLACFWLGWKFVGHTWRNPEDIKQS